MFVKSHLNKKSYAPCAYHARYTRKSKIEGLPSKPAWAESKMLSARRVKKGLEAWLKQQSIFLNSNPTTIKKIFGNKRRKEDHNIEGIAFRNGQDER
jgi:hypothetical protein